MLESESWTKFMEMCKTAGVAPMGNPGPAAAEPGGQGQRGAGGEGQPVPDLHEDMDLDEVERMWDQLKGAILESLAGLRLKKQKRG